MNWDKCLIKRAEGAMAPWYFRFECKGKAYCWSTKTDDKPLAKKRAKNYREQVMAGNFKLVDQMKSRQGGVTYKEVLAEYANHVRPSGTARKNNATAMLKILAASGLTDTAIIADTCSPLLALKWQKHGLAAEIPATTINARLRQARSIFAKKTMIHYTLEMPKEAIRLFFEAPFLPEASIRPELPLPEADAKAHAELPALPEVWRAFLLARYGGLRSGEAIAANKNWIDAAGILWIGGIPNGFITKSRKYRPVALPAQVIEILKAAPGDSLVGAHPKEVVKSTLIAKLHDCGFPAKKPMHALRRLWGSIVYTEQGPRQARDGLGHSTQAVTDKHYARSLDAPKPVTFNAPASRPLAPVVPMTATG